MINKLSFQYAMPLFLAAYGMGFMDGATDNKHSGLWFIVVRCALGALP